MYINEVIDRARAYNPNEYGMREMIEWCNEVSAMLAVEDRIIYRERQLPVAEDGSVLLPEGVEFENVVKLYMGTVRLPARSYRVHGRRLTLPHWLNFHYRDGKCADIVTIVYEEPYSPIRLPKYIGEIKSDPDAGTIELSDCEFIAGDTLIIQTEDKTYTDIYLMDTEPSADDARKWTLKVSGLPEELSGEKAAVITRAITDKTVCAGPYDTMYVDYILSKIALYQKDTATYNLYVNRFNTKLEQYKEWLTSRMPHESVKLRNWW